MKECMGVFRNSSKNDNKNKKIEDFASPNIP